MATSGTHVLPKNSIYLSTSSLSAHVRVQLTIMQPVPLSWLGSWSVAHGDGASTEAAAIVAVYVTANHLMDYFIANVS